MLAVPDKQIRPLGGDIAGIAGASHAGDPVPAILGLKRERSTDPAEFRAKDILVAAGEQLSIDQPVTVGVGKDLTTARAASGVVIAQLGPSSQLKSSGGT